MIQELRRCADIEPSAPSRKSTTPDTSRIAASTAPPARPPPSPRRCPERAPALRSSAGRPARSASAATRFGDHARPSRPALTSRARAHRGHVVPRRQPSRHCWVRWHLAPWHQQSFHLAGCAYWAIRSVQRSPRAEPPRDSDDIATADAQWRPLGGPIATADDRWRPPSGPIATADDRWRPPSAPIATADDRWRPPSGYGDRKHRNFDRFVSFPPRRVVAIALERSP